MLPSKRRRSQTLTQERTTKKEGILDFPIDVWEEILKRIHSVKKLLELKRVCKSWCNVITNKGFAKWHLDHWRPRCHNIMLWRGDTQVLTYDFDKGTSERLFDKVRSKKWYKNLVPSVVRDPRGLNFYFTKHQVLDSCDGLFLIKLDVHFRDPFHGCDLRKSRFLYHDLLVINPATNLRKQLHVDCDAPMQIHYSSWKIVYDASSKCYKVFGIKASRDYENFQLLPNELKISCLIYKLRGGEKEWNLPQCCNVTIERKVSCFVSIIKALSVEGKVHWLINKSLLVSVDVGSYDLKYNFCSGSPAIYLQSRCFTSTETFHCAFEVPNSTEYELWVLEDIEKNPTWVMQKTVSMIYWTPLKCIGNMLIGTLSHNNQVYQYDMISGKSNKIMVDHDHDINLRFHRTCFFSHVVSINHIDSLISSWD